MKKVILILAVSLSYFAGSSQVYVQGGINLANITTNANGNTQDNNMLTTFNAGILGRFDLSRSFDIETGILLAGRGSKAQTYITNSTTDNYVKTKFNPLYLEIPLNAVIRVPLQGKTGLFFNVGPYLGIGVAGKAKSESKILGVVSTSETDIEFNNDDPTQSGQQDAAYNKLKRFDLGLNVGGGFDFGKLLLKANYGYGFSKINSTETNNSSDDNNKYRTVSLSVGIPLGR